jgi:hypothetical protein
MAAGSMYGFSGAPGIVGVDDAVMRVKCSHSYVRGEAGLRGWGGGRMGKGI